MSESTVEATNFDNKSNFISHANRNDILKANLNVFEKSWWSADQSEINSTWAN